MTTEHPDVTRAVGRLLWWSLVGACLLVLGAALLLEPDPRGYGTHTQLGLPPCGFLTWTGAPCPGCGLTTAFAHGIRGHFALALSANPLGLLLFVAVCSAIPLGIAGALRGWSFDAAVQRFSLHRWALALAGCAAVLWAVRLTAAF